MKPLMFGLVLAVWATAASARTLLGCNNPRARGAIFKLEKEDPAPGTANGYEYLLTYTLPGGKELEIDVELLWATDSEIAVARVDEGHVSLYLMASAKPKLTRYWASLPPGTAASGLNTSGQTTTWDCNFSE